MINFLFVCGAQIQDYFWYQYLFVGTHLLRTTNKKVGPNNDPLNLDKFSTTDSSLAFFSCQINKKIKQKIK